MSRVPHLLLLALLMVGCATRIPPQQMDPAPFAGRADSLFLSPVATDGGNARLDARLEKSPGSAQGRLRVWLDFLEQQCRQQGVVLVKARSNDSLAVARFRCPLGDDEWQGLYHAVPGERSRVLVVQGLKLKAARRPWPMRLLEGLGLADDSRREYGWLELDYELYDMALDEGSGPRRLLSREPDTPWVYNHTDRAGRLMMKGAKELGRVLRSGAAASSPEEDREEQQ